MKNKVKIDNNFYYRIPYLSYDKYKNSIAGNIENIECLIKEDFEENLLTSSRELFNSYKTKTATKNKDKALYKYMLRSSVRTTPYGINAAVGKGKFSNDGNLILNEKNRKKVRPDFEWLMKVIQKSEKIINENLKIKTSDCFIERGKKYQKFFDSCFCEDNNVNYISSTINATKLTKKIFELCSDYISIKKVLDELEKIYSPEKRNEIYEIIFLLIDKEFLCSDLRISLLSNDIFYSFLNKLADYNCSDLLKELNNISLLIAEYNQQDIGKGIQMYEKIIEKMKKIEKAKNYLQIDMCNDSIISLNSRIQNDLEEFGNFFLKWCIHETYNDYVNKFREKYGEQAVRLIDVFDLETGLGFPNVDGEITNDYKEWWITILLNLINNNRDKNVIDLSLISHEMPFKYDFQELKFPISYELSFYILQKNGEYKYVISPMFGSESKWKSFGRFDYLFNDSLVENETSINSNGFKEVEVTFYPNRSHDANVSICNTNKKSFIELNSHNVLHDKERISIKDIYMYIDKNSRIGFVQGSTEDVLSFSTMNKYITKAFPDILKALLEIDKNQKPSFESFFYALSRVVNNLSGHIPEIRYKNIVISQECWKIEKNLIYKNGHLKKLDEFKKVIKENIEKILLPSDIHVGPIDRRLILNLNYDIDIEILYDMLKKSDNLQIKRNLFDLYDLVLNKNNEKYIGEFVFQFRQQFNINDKLIYSSKRIPKINKYHEKFFPFNDWITLKLYIDNNIEDIILINQIKDIYNYLHKNNIISLFFFIRYKDPKNHLRIRFKINDCKYAEALKCLNELIAILNEHNILNDVLYETYVPEINRYGGEKTIDLAEELFYKNSLIVLELLKNVSIHEIEEDKNLLFVAGALNLIKNMNINFEEVLKYIERYKLKKEYNKYYREINNKLECYINLPRIKENGKEINKFYKIVDQGKRCYREYWEKIEEIYKERNFDNFIIKRYCINSILHMYFNRLIGIDKKREILLMGVLEKKIYSMIQREKNYLKMEE